MSRRCSSPARLPWIYKGLTLLLIGCPCALVISTPAAITSGTAVAARRGALIKGGAALEQLGSAPVAFDKTGTLTVGQPQVTSVIATAEVDDNALLALAAAVGKAPATRWRRLSSVKRSGVS
ncbi:Lead, cadmium, zinc and mercury-transporting ATPase [Klebsiella pneumoniae]|nr:Lead, cadmium, zinc and mercury-transporting ATPase [Klebsiella pneumoniae]